MAMDCSVAVGGEDGMVRRRSRWDKQAPRQTQFSATSSSPLTRIARAAGRRQPATPVSRRVNTDETLNTTRYSGGKTANISKKRANSPTLLGWFCR